MRYKNCRIELTPTETLTSLVTIQKTPARLKMLLNKRYVNLDKAKIAIDYHRTMHVIKTTNIKSLTGDLAGAAIIYEE
jgi:hypothetical protein